MRRLRNRLRALLHSERGDTFVEVLVAILIAALGAATLSTMIMASVSVSSTSQVALEETYKAEQTMPAVGTRDTVNISLGSVSAEFTVQVYQSPDGMFTRYENHQGDVPGGST